MQLIISQLILIFITHDFPIFILELRIKRFLRIVTVALKEEFYYVTASIKEARRVGRKEHLISALGN